MGKGVKSHSLVVALGLLWGAVSVTACLLPQEDDPLPAIPPQKNRPPRIIRNQVSPQRHLSVYTPKGCTDPEVEVFVDAPDGEDLIRAGWRVFLADGMTRPNDPSYDQSPPLSAAALRNMPLRV